MPTVSIAATNVAAATTVFAGTNNNQFVQIRVVNAAAAVAYISFGVAGSVTTATVASSMPMLGSTVEVFTVAAEISAASVILASGTGTVSFTRGRGV